MATNPDHYALGNFLASQLPYRDAYDLTAIAAAQEMATDDLEVDDNAMTSRGEDDAGCFVMAWLWVPRDKMEYVEDESTE